MNGPSEKPIDGGVTLDLHGEHVRLLGGRAALWERTSTLLLADVHLGKAQAMRSLGSPLPARLMLHRQLDELSLLIRATGARRVLVLGDLLHAAAGVNDELITAFASFAAKSAARIEVVPGNHDTVLARIAEAAPIEVLAASHREGPFVFTHEARVADPSGFTWSGHLHPAITIGGRAARMKLPCFRVCTWGCVLPAFSSFTGGATFERERGERVFGLVEGQVIEVPGRSRLGS